MRLITASTPFLWRDLANGLQQQMFFWGQDVLYPQGNLFLEGGFIRKPSTGLKGTSCYRLEWNGGHIELYGSCVGWYGRDGGFVFIRPWKKSVIWSSKEFTPVPGAWQKEHIDHRAGKQELYAASLPFIRWLISHEKFVNDRCEPNYRHDHHRAYRKVSKARQWVEPEVALMWFELYHSDLSQLTRPRELARKLSVAL